MHARTGTSTFPNDPDVVSVSGGVGAMIATIIVFVILNKIVSYIGVPVVVLKFAVNKEEEAWKWKNLFLSWIHAFIIGLWDILCFYYYPDVWQDLITHITPFTYYMLAVSTGYFIYDFGDLIKQRKVTEMWQLTMHHIAVTSMFFYNLLTRTCIGYNVVALMAEINSFFLHSRKLLQMHRFKFKHPLYRLNAIVNLLTFLLCRGYSLLRISYGMYSEGERVSKFYLYTLSFSMFIMNVINPCLFMLLLKNDFLRKEFKAPCVNNHVQQPEQQQQQQQQQQQNGLTYNPSTESLPGYNALLAENSVDAQKLE